jgi:hypothetical protein
MVGRYKNYINYGGALLLTWLFSFGFLMAIFDVDSSSYTWNFLFKIASPFYAIVIVAAYYLGKTSKNNK